jgi:hypothetical protein
MSSYETLYYTVIVGLFSTRTLSHGICYIYSLACASYVYICIYTRISLWPILLTNLTRQFCYTSKEELDVRLTLHNIVIILYSQYIN